MSWQAYISDYLQVVLVPADDTCDPPRPALTLHSSAIVGQDGGLWARSDDFPAITPDQVAQIVAGFDNPKALGGSGIHMGGLKFQMTYNMDGVIRGATKIDDTKGGCCIKKTNAALVIGIFKDPIPAAACNKVIEDMGEYLATTGY